MPAGDIGAVSKLATARTERHAGAEGQAGCRARRSRSPQPVLVGRHRRPHPGRRGQARPTRCTACRTRIPRLRVERNEETHQTAAARHGRDPPGDHHREAGPQVRRRRSTPRTCGSRYRETITGSAAGVEGKHKKQSGGHGQFGVCVINVEPQPAGRGLPVRRQDRRRRHLPELHPGRPEGRRRGHAHAAACSATRWSTSRSSCIDGKEHSVDCSEMAFKIAGRLAIREALAKANPVLLEPVS